MATQYRLDEGTRDLSAAITNMGDTAVAVASATIDWVGFEQLSVPIDDGTLSPGSTTAFTLRYGDPRCDTEPVGSPRLIVEADGTKRQTPLKVADPQLLNRLFHPECAQQRVEETATVSLRLGSEPVRRRGEEYLPGGVVVERRPWSTARVTVVDLGGSVLLDLVALRGPDALPARLQRAQAKLRLPVLAGSAHRCDPHARGNSQ